VHEVMKFSHGWFWLLKYQWAIVVPNSKVFINLLSLFGCQWPNNRYVVNREKIFKKNLLAQERSAVYGRILLHCLAVSGRTVYKLFGLCWPNNEIILYVILDFIHLDFSFSQHVILWTLSFFEHAHLWLWIEKMCWSFKLRHV